MKRALVVVFGALALWRGVGVPLSWARDLSPSCHWEPRPWALSLSPGTWRPSRAEEARVGRCWAARGGNDRTGNAPFVNTVVRKFPTAREISERNADENRLSLPAPR